MKTEPLSSNGEAEKPSRPVGQAFLLADAVGNARLRRRRPGSGRRRASPGSRGSCRSSARPSCRSASRWPCRASRCAAPSASSSGTDPARGRTATALFQSPKSSVTSVAVAAASKSPTMASSALLAAVRSGRGSPAAVGQRRRVEARQLLFERRRVADVARRVGIDVPAERALRRSPADRSGPARPGWRARVSTCRTRVPANGGLRSASCISRSTSGRCARTVCAPAVAPVWPPPKASLARSLVERVLEPCRSRCRVPRVQHRRGQRAGRRDVAEQRRLVALSAGAG